MTQWQKKERNDARKLLLHEWRPLYRRHHCDRFFASRMGKSDAARMEVDAAVTVAARGAIFKVALYGAAYAGELTADLVVPTGKEFHLNQGITVKLAQGAILKARLLCLRIAIFTYI